VTTDNDGFEGVRRALFGEGDFLAFTRQHEAGIDSPRGATLADGTRVSVPQTGVIRFEPPVSSGTDLVFSTGVHGNETAPIEIGRDLVDAILAGTLVVRNRLMLLIGNPVAVNLGTRFQAENLNRLFDGRHRKPLVAGSYESRRAAELEAFVTDFFESGDPSAERIHYDLHTALRGSKFEQFAIYPFPDGEPWSIPRLQVMLSAGISTILLSNGPQGTFSYFSQSKFGATSFTVELGKVRPFGENDMSRFSAMTDVMRRLIRGESVPVKPYEGADFDIFRVQQVLVKTSDAFVLHVADDVDNYTEFPVGFVLTEDGDDKYAIAHAGECIMFPNPDVAVSQRAGMTLVPATLEAP
jgi:succinylglutamate desuccinylase